MGTRTCNWKRDFPHPSSLMEWEEEKLFLLLLEVKRTAGGSDCTMVVASKSGPLVILATAFLSVQSSSLGDWIRLGFVTLMLCENVARTGCSDLQLLQGGVRRSSVFGGVAQFFVIHAHRQRHSHLARHSC